MMPVFTSRVGMHQPCRRIAVACAEGSHHSPNARPLRSVAEEAAGVEQLEPGFVDRRGVVVHRAHEANLSVSFASFGKSSLRCSPGTFVLIGLNGPRIASGCVGLGIERVEVRRPADHVDEDARLVASGGRKPACCDATAARGRRHRRQQHSRTRDATVWTWGYLAGVGLTHMVTGRRAGCNQSQKSRGTPRPPWPQSLGREPAVLAQRRTRSRESR